MDLNKLTRELWLLEDFSKENVIEIVHKNNPDYKALRKALTGKVEGVSVGLLIYLLGKFESLERIWSSLNKYSTPRYSLPITEAYYFFAIHGKDAYKYVGATDESIISLYNTYRDEPNPKEFVHEILQLLTILPCPFIELPPMTIEEAIKMFPRPNHNKGE